MNKYMEQNWRVENIFLISSQHFLNVTDWEWEALYKHLLYQEGNRCFCRRACLPRVPIPTVGKSGSPPSLNAEEAKTAASPHPCTMLVPGAKALPHVTHTRMARGQVDSRFYFWSIYLISLTFSLVLPSLWQPTKSLILCLFRFQVDNGSLLIKINKPLPPLL